MTSSAIHCKHRPSDQHIHLPISVYIVDLTLPSQNNLSKQENNQKQDSPNTMKSKATYHDTLKMFNLNLN